MTSGWAAWLSAAAGIALALGGAVAGAAGTEGLVGRWTFDEGEGESVRDVSGRGNDGRVHGARFVGRGKGSALEFDGDNDFVDCGTGVGPLIESGGTVELWFSAKEIYGGLVAWSTGGDWRDERLVLVLNQNNAKLMAGLADGSYYGLAKLRPPELGEWNHVALSFDNSTATVFVNGIPVRTFLQKARPALKGVPLWIGRCPGIGTFRGRIDEVRVHDRPLSAIEVLASYKKLAGEMGRARGARGRRSLFRLNGRGAPRDSKA